MPGLAALQAICMQSCSGGCARTVPTTALCLPSRRPLALQHVGSWASRPSCLHPLSTASCCCCSRQSSALQTQARQQQPAWVDCLLAWGGGRWTWGRPQLQDGVAALLQAPRSRTAKCRRCISVCAASCRRYNINVDRLAWNRQLVRQMYCCLLSCWQVFRRRLQQVPPDSWLRHLVIGPTCSNVVLTSAREVQI